MNKTRLLVNALSAQLGGGQTYLLNLFSEDHSAWHDTEVIFLVSASNENVFRQKFHSHEVHSIGSWGDNFFLRTIWENLFLKGFCKTKQIDVVFLPGGTAPLVRRLDLPRFSVSQNQLPFNWRFIREAGGLSQKIRLLILRYLQLWTFRHSTGVIFISKDSQQDLLKKIKRPVSSTVVYHGINPIFFRRDHPRKLAGDYLLYVSTFYPYKRQREVVQAFGELNKRGTRDLKLVLAGKCTGSYYSEVKALVQELGLSESVLFTDNIPYADIAAYMQHATLNVFASECESCPNILLEAMASGRPVVCSEVMPMPEFGEARVSYFDPTRPVQLAELLERTLHDGTGAKHDSQELKSQFEWAKAAKAVHDFIQSLTPP